MRISRDRYQEYDIDTRYPYWRNESQLEMVTLQLEQNLRAKYSEFTGKEMIDEPIIRKFTSRKQISIRIHLHDKEQTALSKA